MNDITDQKRLQLAYKKILQLEDKVKTQAHKNENKGNGRGIPVAVIGAACRYPGGINNIQTLWDSFANNINVVKEIPETRWDLKEIFSENKNEPNKTYCRYGAFFDAIDEFDPLFFNISNKEAERMDPQQRLFLQGCWEAFEDAGYNDTRLNGIKCGVYAGSLNCDYSNVLNTTPHHADLFELIGTQASILSARISYLLNLKGPCITIDTACSSSLVAIDLAVKAIQRGDIDLALAGGVHLYITPNLYIMMSKAQMLSEEGLSKAFDNNANGFSPGEGMAVVTLKALDKAIADGDQIYGVILGGASNQDGKTNGITAPSSLAQTELELEAYNRLNINPETIGYVEAHGTGTKLGDPIEFEALRKSFGSFTQKQKFCAIGSSKTNFGHTLAAAGVTGVLKALLAMRNKKIPANLNFTQVNEHLDYEASPFYINNTLVDWQPSSGPRRSAVSSFGISGTNVHLILEEAPEISVNDQVRVPPAFLILLSAKTQTALQNKINDFKQWISQPANATARMEDIALTLTRGRSHFKYRTGFVVSNKIELLQQLDNGSSPQAGGAFGSNAEINALISQLKQPASYGSDIYADSLTTLLKNYINGGKGDWWQLLDNAGARTISMPNYPYEMEKFWISADTTLPRELNNSASSFSLVDSNESTLESQCYQKTFTGNEFYLKDHVVNLRKMLPGVAYLEMARSSGNLCNNPHKVTRIQNVTWKSPIVVDGGPQTVKISLHPDGEQVGFQVFSTNDGNSKSTIHATGGLLYDPEPPQDEYIDVDALRAELTEFLSQKQCYDTFNEKGLAYGSTFKRVLNLSYLGNRALATIEGLASDSVDDALHPGIMDAALQAVLVLVSQVVEKSSQHYLPYMVEQFEIRHPLTTRCHSFVTRREKAIDDPDEHFDVKLTDEQGKVLLCVTGLKLVPVKQDSARLKREAEQLYYSKSLIEARVNTLSPDIVKNQFFSNQRITDNPAIIVVGNHRGKTQGIDEVLLSHYLETIHVEQSDGFQPYANGQVQLDITRPEHAELLLESLAANQITPEYVLWLVPPMSDLSHDQQIQQFQFMCRLAKHLIQYKTSRMLRLVTLEMSTAHELDSDSAFSGFFKTLAQENPNYNGKHLVFGTPLDSTALTQAAINELFNTDFNSHPVLYKDGARFKKRLQKMDIQPFVHNAKNAFFKEGGVYLITGGLHGVGLTLAHEISSQADTHLFLLGRSTPTAQSQQQIDSIQKNLDKGSVTIVQADVSNPRDMQRVVDDIIHQQGKLNGILHCAGVKRDSFILKKTDQEIEAVLRPKVTGTLNIDEVTKDITLDFIVLFSSIASVFGNPGQSDYAFANGFMDDFAAYRNMLTSQNKRTGHTLSINWPLWETGGMQLDDSSFASMDDLFGMRPIDGRLGLKALETCLHAQKHSVMFMFGDQVKTEKSLRKGLADDRKELPSDITQLDNLQRDTILQETERFVKLLISDEMKIPYEKLDSDAPFENFGMDSVVFMSLNQKLESKFGEISKTLFYEYQNIGSLTDYFVENYLDQLLEITDIQLQGKTEPKAQPLPTVEAILDPVQSLPRFKSSAPTSSARPEQDIAIIGVSGRYPQATNLQEFWRNLLEGKDCVEEIPLERWDHSRYFSSERGTPGKTYSKWGGFIDGHNSFDAFFFNISPKEAALIDPQERVFLETSWQAIADAGYSGKSLSNSQVGVYAGVMWNQYQLLGIDPEYAPVGGVPESLISSVANRVSYFFDFHGPSIGLDTMCSSSLTALHMACEAIRSGEIDYALAGGVNLIVHPSKYLRLAQGNFASSDGRCRSFGAGGDGYVPGEGVGVTLLKPLDKAIADNDHIYGVIKSTHINHGGKTNGYTVPNPVQQGELIRHALKKANIHPESISYVEAHGTGTALGDPIEVTGLTQAYRSHTDKTGFCALGSVKASIGHLESAAGISALSKVILQFKHDMLTPTLHCQEENPNIDLESTPFVLQKEAQAWSAVMQSAPDITRDKRRAAISSFGAGGANAHLIVEEPPIRSVPSSSMTSDTVFTFSAKDNDRLKRYALAFVSYLEQPDIQTTVALMDIAYTLNVGRDLEPARLAIVASSHLQLLAGLKAYLDDKQQPETNWFCGDARKGQQQSAFLPTGDSGKTYISSLVVHRELNKLAALWTQGADIDWQSFFSQNTPFRTPLPSAPFNRDIYWVDLNTKPATTAITGLHPLLDRNTSTLDQQTYAKTFTGSEPVVRDHRIGGNPILPAAGYIEMVRAAMQQATSKNVTHINHIQWQRPILIQGAPVNTQLHLELLPKGVAFELVVLNENGSVAVCCDGEVADNIPTITAPDNAFVTTDKLPNTLSQQAFYQALNEKGFDYRNSFRSISEIHFDSNYVIATLASSDDKDTVAYLHSVAVLDAAFQSVVPLLDTQSATVYVPAKLESLCYFNELAQAHQVLVSRNTAANEDHPCFDIQIVDHQGSALCFIRAFTVAPFAGAVENIDTRTIASGLHYFSTHWQDVATPVLNAQKTSSALVLNLSRKILALQGIQLTAAAEFFEQDNTHFSLNVTSSDSWERLLAATIASNDEWQLVLIAPNDPAQLTGFIELFNLFKAFTRALKNRAARLLLVHEKNSAASALSGFIKTLDQEFSNITCLTVDVENLTNSDMIQQAITTALAYPAASALATETRFNNHQLSIKQALPLNADNQQSSAFRSHGVYWITGGASGIGRLVAHYLAENYQANIIISGRSALNDKLQQFVDTLRHRGSEVLYLSADVSNQTDMMTVVEKTLSRFGHINGIIHSAGITRDALLINKTVDNFTQVAAPKILGVEILDSVAATLKLDFLLLFSSISAVVGNPGQVDYATANSYLDHFAKQRNQRVAAGERYGKTISINWPYWQSGGMQISQDLQHQVFAATGLEPLPTDEGLAAIEFALTHNLEQLLVCKGHHDKILRTLNGEKATAVTSSPARVTDANADENVTRLLRQIVAKETRWDAEKITESESFSTYGIDSVMTLNLTRKLSETFGDLPKTLFFEYTNIAQLREYLIAHHGDALNSLQGETYNTATTANSPAQITRPTAARTITSRRDHLLGNTQNAADNESIAIIGLAGRYPKASSLQEFYRNLCDGVDAITEIPATRWDNALFFDANRHTQQKGKSYGQWGGFIEDIDQFDPLFFNISPADAITIDPQERLFLESSWHAFEDAGYTRARLSGSKTGVFAGVMWNHYQLHGVDTTPTVGNKYPESSSSSIANRVSYFFELEGPSLAIDTMCSSSLTAINLACEALKRNDCSMAIAGGINLALHPYKYQQLSGSQFLSTDGRCRSFGEGGDGYVPGEGVGSVLLKPLSKAIADGDKIYGVIKGGALNHGGKSNGYNVPNPRAQGALIHQAITSAKVDARNISYIEAHGTGTPLGDPIELQGLKRAFSQHSSPERCALGSVKSNIGHLEAASGIAALTKVLLQMQSRTLFPSLHADSLNPNLDFADAPFRVQTELAPWGSQAQPVTAGISSFGAGGSNAFLLVESVNSTPQTDSGTYGEIVLPLSAHNDRALQDVVNQFISLLTRVTEKQLPQSENYTIESLAHSLQNYRSTMTTRLAIVARSLDDFANKLAAISISQQQFPDGVYYGVADDTASNQENSIHANHHAPDLAQHWCQGGVVDFKKAYANINSTRLWLPPYPFAKKTYWYEGKHAHTSSITINQSTSAHQGALECTLDLSASMQAGLQYKTQIHPDNALVKHHRFNDQSLLPGAAYISMIAHTLKPAVTQNYLKLHQLVWKQPLFVKQAVCLFSTYQPKSNSRYTCDLWTGSATDKQAHASASIDVVDSATVSSSMVTPIGDYTASIDKQHFYALFADYRIEYNDIFRCVQSAKYNQQSAELVYQVAQTDSHTQLAILIDAALQSFVLLQDPAQPQAKLPFTIENTQVHLDLTEATGTTPLAGRIHIQSTRKNIGNAVVMSSDGTPLVVLEGIQFRQFSQPTAQQHAPAENLETQLTNDVLAIFRRKMNLAPSEITAKTAFDRIGLESVIAVDIVSELRTLADAIPSGYLLEHKSIASLVSGLLSEFVTDITAYYNKAGLSENTPAATQLQKQPPPLTAPDLAAQQLPVLQKIFAEAMAMSPTDVGKKVSFDKYGLESVKATEITRSLSDLYGDLPSTVLFEHQTLESLAQFLADEKSDQCRAISQRSASTNNAVTINTATQPAPPLSDNDLRARVNQLTDSEVDSLLNNLLGSLADANTEQNSYES